MSALDVGRGVHFTVTAALALAACVLTVPRLLPSPPVMADRGPHRGPHRGRNGTRLGWSRPVVLLGALAFCLTFAEVGATHWSGVYLRDELHAGPGLAGAAVTVFLVAVAVGRLAGDRLVTRFGPVGMVRASAAAGGLGLVAGLLLGSVPAGMAGFALLGLGLSVTLPLALSAAGGLAGQPAAQAVARVSTLGYLGSFVAPVVIGALAGWIGLATALLLPAALVLLVAAAAPRTWASRDAS